MNQEMNSTGEIGEVMETHLFLSFVDCFKEFSFCAALDEKPWEADE